MPHLVSLLLLAVAPLADPLLTTPRAQGDLAFRVLADCRDGRLDDRSFFEAALILGGVERADEAHARRRQFDRLVAELRPTAAAGDSSRSKAAIVLAFLHARVLTGDYRLTATSLTDALDFGDYNCVSATILFQCLAAECGLTCRAVGRPDHVYNQVALAADDGNLNWLDVESTNRLGFPSSAGSPTSSSPVRELSAVQLLATLCYNRGHEHFVDGRYPQALVANLQAVELDSLHRPAYDNLLATINNWALHLAESGDLTAALDLLAYGQRLAPDHESFRVNLAVLRQRARSRP